MLIENTPTFSFFFLCVHLSCIVPSLFIMSRNSILVFGLVKAQKQKCHHRCLVCPGEWHRIPFYDVGSPVKPFQQTPKHGTKNVRWSNMKLWQSTQKFFFRFSSMCGNVFSEIIKPLLVTVVITFSMLAVNHQGHHLIRGRSWMFYCR